MEKTEPPSDFEAEKKLIGAILLRPEAMLSLFGRVEYTDFYFKPYGLMYAAICDLAVENRPISVSTVARAMNAAGLAQFGGVAKIAECQEGVTGDEADFWANRVVAMRKRRQLLAAAEEASRLALGDEDPDGAIARVEGLLADAATGQDNATINMEEGTRLFLNRMERYLADPEALGGLETGWRQLDRRLDGLHAGAVTIVYARTSSYKSFFVMNIGWRLSRDGVPGLWFNTEMPHHETMTRLIQLEAGLNYRETRYRRELHANEALIRDAAAAVSQYPIWFNDRSALDISFIRGAVTRMKKQRNIKYVVVDLLDHVYSDKFRDNEVKNVAYVVQQMKEMAKREEVHVILTTHVRKPAWNAPQKPYIDLEEMKDSGAKYQDVDTAISLMVVKFDVDKGRYLPMSYEEIVEERQMARKHIVYVATTKNRNGDLGGTPFLVDLERGGLMRPEAE